MKDLIEKLRAKLSELRQTANTQLAKLQPMEQQEAAQEMAWVFRAGRNCLEQINEIISTAEGKLSEYAENVKEAVRAELRGDQTFRLEVAKDAAVLEVIRQELVKDGSLLTKADAEGRIEQAGKLKEKEARDAMQAEAAEKEKIATRRGEAVTALTGKLTKALGASATAVATEVASRIPEAKLKADDYKVAIDAAVARIEKSIAVDVTNTGTLQEVASMEDTAFGAMHAGWEESHKKLRGTSRTPLATSSAASRAGAGAETEDKPKRLLF